MGTAFRIYLPATEAQAETADRTALSSPRSQGSETILVVDDHADLRDLAGLILKQSGYAVLMADGPAAALDIARSHSDPIDLLLTDVILPGMNGRLSPSNSSFSGPQQRSSSLRDTRKTSSHITANWSRARISFKNLFHWTH
jgi:hypothetical protein